MCKVENVTGNIVVADYEAGAVKKGYAVTGKYEEVTDLSNITSSGCITVSPQDGAIIVQAIQSGRAKFLKVADCSADMWKVRTFELEKFSTTDEAGKVKEAWGFCEDIEVNKHLRKMFESLVDGFKPNEQAVIKLFGWVDYYEKKRVEPVVEDTE